MPLRKTSRSVRPFFVFASHLLYKTHWPRPSETKRGAFAFGHKSYVDGVCSELAFTLTLESFLRLSINWNIDNFAHFSQQRTNIQHWTSEKNGAHSIVFMPSNQIQFTWQYQFILRMRAMARNVHSGDFFRPTAASVHMFIVCVCLCVYLLFNEAHVFRCHYRMKCGKINDDNNKANWNNNKNLILLPSIPLRDRTYYVFACACIDEMRANIWRSL